jgi:uncharacterized membrane protein
LIFRRSAGHDPSPISSGTGWLATKLFHVVTLHGFFNLSTWLTVIAGAAILLLAYHLLTSRSVGRSSSGRSRRWAHR